MGSDGCSCSGSVSLCSDSFAGIAPVSAPAFIAGQLRGGLAAVGLLHYLSPAIGQESADVVVPHDGNGVEPTAQKLMRAANRPNPAGCRCGVPD